MAKGKKVFVSDCEGPISKNDNAFELASRFVPQGDLLFKKLSKYDDVLADVVKKPGYKAGNTLCLILPFLKSHGVTNEAMHRFSAETLVLMKHSVDALRFLRSLLPSYIVSTSYEHYVRALCDVAGFPFENTYHTKIDIDSFGLPEDERQQVIEMMSEIQALPQIEVPHGVSSVDELPPPSRLAVRKLDEIFWERFPRLKCNAMLTDVKVMGGVEKANAIVEIARRERCEVSDVIYFGDSITDVEAFRLVKSGGGLSVSFNGNEYAVREAQVAVLSETAAFMPVLALLFIRHGEELLELLEGASVSSLIDEAVELGLEEKLASAASSSFVKVEVVKPSNRERLSLESSSFRKSVRGVAVGELG